MLVFSLLGAAHLGASPADTARAVTVLFVGNSYTYYNELPTMLTEMCHTAPISLEITHASHYPGGSSLVSNSKSSELSELFATREGWDYVVLQDQSQVPAGWFPPTTQFLGSLAALADYYAPRIRAAGAKVILYRTWGRRTSAFPVMNEALGNGYSEYELELRLLLGSLPWDSTYVTTAHVGSAFNVAYVTDNSSSSVFYSLYDPDGSHPSAAGTYVAALCMYHALTESKGDVTGITYCPPELDQDLCKFLRENVAKGSTELGLGGCNGAPRSTNTGVETPPAASDRPPIPPRRSTGQLEILSSACTQTFDY